MRKQLGQMLIEAGAIDEATLRSALADQRRWGRPLGRTLVELRLINEEELIRILGQQLGLPSIDLDRVTVPKAVLDMVPVKLVNQHAIMPFAIAGKFLDVAMADPTNLGIIDELRIRTQLNIRSYLAGPWMIERAIFRHYGGANPQIGTRVGPSRAKTTSQTPEVIGFDATVGADAAVEHSEVQPRTTTRDTGHRNEEIDALQDRISRLEALVARDENVLRKLLALIIDKGLATREEIVDRLG
jgi:type IV pilus assembly protein PilB